MNNLLIFTFMYAMLEMACMLTDTQLSTAWIRNWQVFEESACTLYFTCKLLNLTPQFLSSLDCTCIDLISEFLPPKEKSRGSKSDEQAGQETGSVCGRSSVQDNFRAAIDALHDCNVVERPHVETACEDARIERSSLH
jgi:hypothetical protein